MADFEKPVFVDEATYRGTPLCDFANMKCPNRKEVRSCLALGKFRGEWRMPVSEHSIHF